MNVVYFIRHATPKKLFDNIPYDVLPGPPLSDKGIVEANQLGEFFKLKKIAKLYCSPFLRTRQTAQIIGSAVNVSWQEEHALTEWSKNENENDIVMRVSPLLDMTLKECTRIGSIGLVTHGGLIKMFLRILGIDKYVLDNYLRIFDPKSPLPPAGVWAANIQKGISLSSLSLVYTPVKNDYDVEV